MNAAVEMGSQRPANPPSHPAAIFRCLAWLWAIAFLTEAAASHAAGGFGGSWQGTITLEGQSHAFELTIDATATAASIRVADADPQTFASTKWKDQRIVLTTTGGSVMEGELRDDGSLHGSYLHAPGRRGRFHATRIADHIGSRLHRGPCTGSDGQRYVLGEVGGAPAILRAEDGLGRLLQPGGPGQWTFGPAIAVARPVQGTITFEPTGHAEQSARLDWTKGDEPAVALSCRSVERQAVAFQNGDVRLHGELTRPTDSGPVPSVVLLHGSGPQTGGEPWSDLLIARGFAVLSFDKRGSGQSTGNWRAGFETLAEDAQAAVTWLRSQPGIDPERIGLIGPSQGGTVALLAAAADPRIAWVVLRSTSMVTPAAQERYRLSTLLAQTGHNPRECAAADAFLELKFMAASTGQWTEYEARAAKLKSRPWFELVGGAPPRESAFHAFWKEHAAFDPLSVAARVRQPVLWLLAEFDESSPPPAETLLARARAVPNLDVEVITGADHGMMATGEMHQSDEALPTATGYAPDYLRTLLNWVEARATSRTEKSHG